VTVFVTLYTVLYYEQCGQLSVIFAIKKYRYRQNLVPSTLSTKMYCKLYCRSFLIFTCICLIGL
jgi:hypothetical protein